jgi:opacity protein-like surface antigen
MKNQIKKYIAASLLITAATVRVVNAASLPSPIEEYSRTGKLEIYAIAESLNAWEKTKFDHGNSVKIDSGIGGGVGFGYNINEYLNVNTSITGTGVGFKARNSDFGSSSSGDIAVVKWDVNLDYNILKKRLTPVLTAGAGMAYFSGGFDNSSFLDFGETDLIWGVGGGVRWDISDHWFAKAIYRVNWTTLQDSENTTRFNSIALGIGYKF